MGIQNISAWLKTYEMWFNTLAVFFIGVLATYNGCIANRVATEIARSNDRAEDLFNRQVATVGEIKSHFRDATERYLAAIDAQSRRQDRTEFLDALRQAEQSCSGNGAIGVHLPCSAPLSSVRIPLDICTRLEPRLRNDLSLMEYLKLATVGCKVWDFEQSNEICSRMLPVVERSHSPEERAFAYMVIAHVKFKYSKSEASCSLAEARSYCSKAADPLEADAKNLEKFYYLGQIYANWALHERCWGLDAEAKAKSARAKDWWSKLAIGKSLNEEFESVVSCVGECQEAQAISPTVLLDPTIQLVPAGAAAPPAPAPAPAPIYGPRPAPVAAPIKPA